jgi:arginine N-succinyltransferase
MFILRSVQPKDLKDLYQLSTIMTFINLPADSDLIREKIESSMKSFKNPNKDLSKNYYIFVLENFNTGEILGVSMIHAQHGTENEPHFYLTVGQEAKFSQTINTGFVHGTLKLGLDSNGPTEIGGLILNPDYRGNKDKLGKQLSFVRFLFMANNSDRFKPMVHSELLPPFDRQGNSPLWEAVGRRFLNMNYVEADLLSRSNKEFILSLFPSENIYQTLLPMEARESIGKVGKETEPVRRMLESIGFKYTYEVDPFDGGPHYRCPLKDIKPVREKMTGHLISAKTFDPSEARDVLITLEHPDYDFFATRTLLQVHGDGQVSLDPQLVKELNLKLPQKITAIPFN